MKFICLREVVIMKNNMNIDNTKENMEDVAIGTVEEVKIDKITSAKMLQSTKDIIDTFNLKGNQQEKLDSLVKDYRRLLEEAQGIVKEEVTGLDLSNEFNSFSKDLNIFVQTIEQKVNTYMNNTVAVNVSNTEKEFGVLHSEFMKYLEEVQSVAVASESELEENKQKVEELTIEVKELKTKNEELTSENAKLNKEYTKLSNKNSDLLDSIASLNSKYENEKSSKNAQIENSNILKNEIRDLKETIISQKKELTDNKILLESIVDKKSDLEVKNEQLRVANTGLVEKNTQLEEDSKHIQDVKKELFEKVELVAQLERRNEILEKDLQELNTLKTKNMELEGSVKALEGQSKILETTLNTVNMTISSITDAKVNAEEKSTRLELENTRLVDANTKLLEELEELKKQLKAKK